MIAPTFVHTSLVLPRLRRRRRWKPPKRPKTPEYFFTFAIVALATMAYNIFEGDSVFEIGKVLGSQLITYLVMLAIMRWRDMRK
jgi:lipid-A-disaccharide synthase-like uncharacterized protein